MTSLTPEEEQAMIDRAKAGDPEANYNMSLWALDQALAEPDEDRWNRLAAKCLVRAAEAGYPPARERMGTLLRTQKPGGQAPDGGETPGRESARAGTAAFSGRRKRAFSRADKAPDPDRPTVEVRHVAKKEKSGLFRFSQWDDAQWKKMQIVCVAICVVLAVLIAVMLISGRKSGPSQAEEASATPVPTAEAATPVPALYPDSGTRQEIASANLEVFPADGDYVQAPTAAVVDTSGSSLRLRLGPGSSYGEITTMENGESVEIFAYQNGWALARYTRYNGSVWGWCSGDYLRTSEAPETP